MRQDATKNVKRLWPYPTNNPKRFKKMSIVESFDILDSRRNRTRRQWKSPLVVCLAAGLMILSSYCGVVVAATLDDISFSSLPGDRV